MPLILEVKSGPLAGKRINVPAGKKFTIGRAGDRANFAIPHDSFMSGVHFAVECGPAGCKVTDRGSSNGTFLNGARITDAPLADGDEIRSGQTIFMVRMVSEAAAAQPASAPPAPRPAARAPKSPKPAPPPAPEPAGMQASGLNSAPSLPPAPPPRPRSAPAPESTLSSRGSAPPGAPPRAKPASPAPAPAQPRQPALVVGAWTFGAVPQGWEAQGEFGIQRVEKDTFPSSVVVTEEPLGGASLDHYVEAQVAMLRQYLREPRIEAALPPAVSGADEAVAVDIRYPTSDGKMVFLRRIFARRGQRAGVLTLTTLEKDWAEIQPAFQAVLAGVSFAPGS